MSCRIIGIGNLLLGDDGAGIHAIRELEKTPLPAEVELVDAGTDGWGVLSQLEGAGKLILIDAVEMGAAPGTSRRFKLADVKTGMERRELPAHTAGLLEILQLAERTGLQLPETVIYGIQPAALEYSMELSPVCRQSLARVVAQILEEIQREPRMVQSREILGGCLG